MPSRKTAEIQAIHEDNLAAVLESLGLLSPIEAGEAVCAVCGIRLALTNVGSITLVGDATRVTCDHLDCLERTRD
jgi:hypothetical protein